MNFGTPLNTLEVDQFLAGFNLKCIIYDELKDMTLDDIFKNAQFAIILYTSDYKKVGHFSCIINRGKQKSGRFLLEYFEPTGIYPKPDQVCSILNKQHENKSKTYLTDIFNKFGCDVLINEYKLQAVKSNLCGKFCIIRCQSAKTELDDFAEILLEHKTLSPDQIVERLVRVSKIG